MNSRQSKKAAKRMFESKRLWDFYGTKKWSKHFLRMNRKWCAEQNRILEDSGSPYRVMPYVLSPFTPTIRESGTGKVTTLVNSRYAAKKVYGHSFYTFNFYKFNVDKDVKVW